MWVWIVLVELGKELFFLNTLFSIPKECKVSVPLEIDEMLPLPLSPKVVFVSFQRKQFQFLS
jgi:hypothetical protein